MLHEIRDMRDEEMMLKFGDRVFFSVTLFIFSSTYMEYGYTKQFGSSFEDAVAKTKGELQNTRAKFFIKNTTNLV